MKTFRSALVIAAMAMFVGGAAAAFADSSQGHTPDYSSATYQKMMGNGNTGPTQQGATASAAAKQADSNVISQLKSPLASSKLSSSELSSLASTFVSEGTFGTGRAPAQVYF
jgi:hypothetical protein